MPLFITSFRVGRDWFKELDWSYTEYIKGIGFLKIWQCVIIRLRSGYFSLFLYFFVAKNKSPEQKRVLWGLVDELSLSSEMMLSRCCAASSGQSSDGQQETEVVPAAIVVNLIEIHIIREKRDDESDRRDNSMPQTEPETGDVPI